jgi:heptose I phosphotransferase
MTFYLDKTLQAFFTAKKSLFDQLMALQGEVYRQLEGRTTQRVLIGSTYYFIKQHTGVGIREILKNLCQGKLPVISAKNEWLAIAKLKQIGIKVPAVLGFGERGFNPANKESFILLAEITNSESLEDITANWQKIAPDFKQKRAYIYAIS